MTREYQLPARRQAILAKLDSAGELSVSDLALEFHVSEVTIRQDLQALAEENRIRRTRGGAMSLLSLPELSFDVRQQQHAAQKSRIAQAAGALIHEGDSVVIDASTTCLAILPFLKNFQELTVITNSLKVAMGLIRSPHVHVFMPSGTMRRDSVSIVGLFDNQFFTSLNARLGFFGARGITIEQGLTDINLEEARMKQRLAGMCQVVIGLLDGSKWGQMGFVTYAKLSQVQCIITDDSAPAGLVDAVRGLGTEVTLV